MCLGIPMQVVEVAGPFAWCEGRGRRERLNTILLEEVSPGDWVYAVLGQAPLGLPSLGLLAPARISPGRCNLKLRRLGIDAFE